MTDVTPGADTARAAEVRMTVMGSLAERQLFQHPLNFLPFG